MWNQHVLACLSYKALTLGLAMPAMGHTVAALIAAAPLHRAAVLTEPDLVVPRSAGKDSEPTRGGKLGVGFLHSSAVGMLHLCQSSQPV